MARKTKPRAWSTQVGKYPDAPAKDAGEERFERIIQSLDGKSMKELAEVYTALDTEHEAVEKRRKEIDTTYEVLYILMKRHLETFGTDIWRDPELGTFFPDYEPIPSIKDKVALVEFYKRTGQEAKLKLPWTTVKADLKEALGPTGSGVVPDGVEVQMKTTVKRRKA